MAASMAAVQQATDDLDLLAHFESTIQRPSPDCRSVR
jgi:hypothetical protein